MDKKAARLIVNKSGGTSGSGGYTFRSTLPTSWIRDMGLGENERDIELIYDEESQEITIRKKVVPCSKCGQGTEYQMAAEDNDGTVQKYYKCDNCNKCFKHIYQKNKLLEEQEVDCSETYII